MVDWQDRFWAKVEQPNPPLGCWEWRAYRNADGYGTFNRDRSKPERAHRVAYELVVGPIPEGLTLDHLCRNRGCVNPTHLEPVPNRVNLLRGENSAAKRARQTVCKRGHPLAGPNLHVDPRGYRRCKACQALWFRERYARLREAPDGR